MNNLATVSFMPIFEGKRLEFVGVKFSEAEKNAFEKIGADEDRALSYVVRELALRGLVQYLQDENLKTTPSEIEKAKQLLNLNKGKEVAPSTKKKVLDVEVAEQDMGLRFGGGDSPITSEEKAAELKRQQDEAVEKIKKNKK